jgi:hypothetical protein
MNKDIHTHMFHDRHIYICYKAKSHYISISHMHKMLVLLMSYVDCVEANHFKMTKLLAIV